MVMLAFLLAAEGGAPASPFEVNFGLFFWTWLVFIGLFLALRKFAWPAILKATEEREQTVARQLAEAATLNAEAKKLAEEQRKLLADARSQASALLAEARAVTERERAQAIEKTKAEQEELLARARREIEAERQRAAEALRAEAVELSLAAAGKVVGARLDAETDRKIALEYIASLDVKH